MLSTQPNYYKMFGTTVGRQRRWHLTNDATVIMMSSEYEQMNKPALQVGQRWIWEGKLLAEIIAKDSMISDAKVIAIIGPGYCFASLGESFKIAQSLEAWVYLEGQDAPNENLSPTIKGSQT